MNDLTSGSRSVFGVGLVGLLVLLLLAAGCSEEGEAATGNAGDVDVDGGDGAKDNFDYSGGEGAFNDDGIWEQNQEFCYPPKFPQTENCEGDEGLWPKALQMALWFFNINKSGGDVYCDDVQWRGDAHMSDGLIQLVAGDANGVDMSQEYIDAHIEIFDPDGDGMVDLSGGYYDAGDYIKFAMTQSYMASTIGWAMIEFPDAFKKTGLEGEAFEQIKWVADYYMKATFVVDKSLDPSEWDLIGYAHQVADDSDHTCGWMPPELRTPEQCPRKAYFATKENGVADVTANSAAALVITGLLFQEEDPDYAKKCFDHGIALYNFASQYPDRVATAAGGLYLSDYAYDDLAWAATWLYEATGDEDYFEQALDWIFAEGFMGPSARDNCFEPYVKWGGDPPNCWTESHTHVWDSMRSGLFVRLADAMTAAGHPYADAMRYTAKNDTLGWVDGPHSPQGYAYKVSYSWGSARYNAAGQLVALVYAKSFPDDADTPRIIDWARDQSLYLLGENNVNDLPDGKSFMMGFTEISPNYPTQPHHAGGHASIWGEPSNPTENRHILWGALVNGPVPPESDTHADERGDFGENEVTIDYNAAWVGALAGNTYFQSDKDGKYWDPGNWCPDPSFPQGEDPIDEFYTLGQLNTEGDCRSQVTITMVNESIHPPRFNEHLTARYYIDVTELVDAGKDPADMTATINYDNGAGWEEPTMISGPFKCENTEEEGAQNMWYFTLSYEGYNFWGRQQQLKGPRTTQVDFGMPNNGTCIWDPSNDWSYDSLTATEEIKTPHITAYGEEGKLLWGEEPPCHPIQKKIIPPVVID